MNDSSGMLKPRPISRGWYFLSLAAVVAGFVAMGAFMVPRIMSIGDKLIQVVAPTDTQITLTEPGHYTIFHESETVVDGEVFSSRFISGLRVVLTSVDTGEQVPLAMPSANMTYSFGNRTGSAVFTFDIAKPGNYRLAASYEDGAKEPRAVLAVGHDFMGALMSTILGALGMAFGGFIAGGAIAAVIWRKRHAVLDRPVV
jgi:hypothetical protein